MAHLDQAARHIDEVRRLAIRVALDDFGTGHSSLTLLRSMAVDELKVDEELRIRHGYCRATWPLSAP